MLIYKVIFASVSKDLHHYYKGAINRWQTNCGGIVSAEYDYIVCGGNEGSREAFLLENILNGSSAVFKWDKYALSEKYAYQHAQHIYDASLISQHRKTA